MGRLTSGALVDIIINGSCSHIEEQHGDKEQGRIHNVYNPEPIQAISCPCKKRKDAYALCRDLYKPEKSA
jgi:hypothetical protein